LTEASLPPDAASGRSRFVANVSLADVTRADALLAVLSDEYESTETLYDRVGYPTLVRLGLVPYATFRSELVRLQAQKLAESKTGEDGATLWRRGIA
jgi:hypothetical protein